MKKAKQPGDNISLKTKKNEHPLIMQWLNAQSNLMDSLRYLIENEIHRHGVRNLQTCIPADRSFMNPAAAEPAVLPGALPYGAAHGEVAAAAPDAPQRAQEDDIDDADIDAWI